MCSVQLGFAFVRWGVTLVAVGAWAVGCESATEPIGRGPVAQIALASGNDQIGPAGVPLRNPLVVRVVDAAGAPIGGAAVTFTVIQGEGSLENGSAVSGRDGTASSGAWTLGPTLGTQQVMAQSGGAEVVFSGFAYGPPTDLAGRLAFVSSRDGNSEIYAVDADGSDLVRLTTNAAWDAYPAWSPDGRQIAFVSDRDGAPSIYIMSGDGSDVTRRTSNTVPSRPTWSPDGSAIAFSTLLGGTLTIATVDVADGRITYLPNVDLPRLDPSWSPDGRQFAFIGGGNLYTVNADGTDQERRTFLPRRDSFTLDPAWSPDGSMIAFVYGSTIHAHPFPDVRFRVAVVSAEGVFLEDLVWAGDTGDFADPGPLTWSPDGRGIAYSDIGDWPTTVSYISLDGTQRGVIVEDALYPSWRR